MLKASLSSLEKQFRASARWVYAFNQSRAKVVLDPIYYAVASRLLPKDTPLSARLVAAKIPRNLFPSFRAQSRKLQYFIEDWDFSEARPELLTERQRHMMHTVALGETSGAAVGDGFLRAFRSSPELAAFFGTWFTEELNHFLGYHLYLEKMGERWPVERGLEVAEVEFIPYAEDMFEVATCNMYQELLGFLVYRAFSQQVRDPFLAKMLAQFAKDELRHYKFYQSVVVRKIQQEPDFRRVVLKTFLKATSPYNQVAGGPLNVFHHLESGAFYFRRPEFEFFLREVQFLLGAELRPFFEWYFKGLIPPCDRCGHEPYQCACEQYEDPTARHEPERADWWKKASARRRLFGLLAKPEVHAVPEGGLEAMLDMARGRRNDARS